MKLLTFLLSYKYIMVHKYFFEGSVVTSSRNTVCSRRIREKSRLSETNTVVN